MTREKYTITDYLCLGRNFANMLWWKLLFLFGVRRSALPIPDGMYCYAPDIEKNEARKEAEPYAYYIKPCKYYKTLGRRYNGCSYLGVITDDMTFDDQCKICSENYGNVNGSATVDINTQVEILKKVINKLMITFDDENDRMDYILDICNEYRKEAEKHYR